MDIDLPHNWETRPYQDALWRYLAGGGKRAVGVWHRRSGKDEIALHWTATAAMERVGNYWHMLPKANQARTAIWEAINPKTGKRRNLGTFDTREQAEKHEREVQYFKRRK